MVGTDHRWSPAHLHRYLAEFDFCYSMDSSDAERAAALLGRIVGKRLTYR